MSAADKHRRDANENLSRAYGDDLDFAPTRAAMAVASALLAIEARLGELVEAQHTATLLAGSAYGMADPGIVQRLVDAVGDAMTGTKSGDVDA